MPIHYTLFHSLCFLFHNLSGCYLFPDGNDVKQINDAGCDTQHNSTCTLDIKIQAPINTGFTSCKLDWTTSSFAISGFRWYPFKQTSIKEIEINSTFYPAALQVSAIGTIHS